MAAQAPNQPRKRGRPPGSKNRRRRPSQPRRKTGAQAEAQFGTASDPFGKNASKATDAESSRGTTETSEVSSAATGAEESIDERLDAFENVASKIPDVIGEEPETNRIQFADDAPLGGDNFSTEEVAEQVANIENGFPKIVNERAMQFYMAFGFDYYAMKIAKDPRWRLDKEEIEMGGAALLPVVEKWLPSLLGTSPYKEELAFGLVMLGIVGPRLTMPKLPTSTAGTVTKDSSANPESASHT